MFVKNILSLLLVFSISYLKSQTTKSINDFNSADPVLVYSKMVDKYNFIDSIIMKVEGLSLLIHTSRKIGDGDPSFYDYELPLNKISNIKYDDKKAEDISLIFHAISNEKVFLNKGDDPIYSSQITIYVPTSLLNNKLNNLIKLIEALIK
jgi:hypothetical protein